MSVFVTTTAGNAAATIADVSGPKISIASFKLTSSIFTPSAGLTALPSGIVYTGVCSHFSAYSADTVQVVCEVPANVGPFNYGGIGLYLADGTLYATLSYNSIKTKAIAASDGYSEVLRWRCLLKLTQSPSAVFNFYTNSADSIGEIPNFTYLLPPSAAGTTPAFIVHEPTPDGESVLVFKNTASSWTPDRYVAVNTATVTAATATTLSAAYFSTVPTSLLAGQYLVQTSAGQIRASASAGSGILVVNHAFAPVPAVGSTVRVYKYLGDTESLTDLVVDKLSDVPDTGATSAQRVTSREILFDGSNPSVTRSTSGVWTLDGFFAITGSIVPSSVGLTLGNTEIKLPTSAKVTNLTAGQYVVKLASDDKYAFALAAVNSDTLTLNGDVSSWLSLATPIVLMQSTAAYCKWHISGDPHNQYVLPPGLVFPYYGSKSDVLDGMLPACGGLVSRTIYPQLYKRVQALQVLGLTVTDADWVLGDASVRTKFSTGDNTTNFRLPDLRGMHARFWDAGRGLDTGRALGSYQEDAVQNITGSFGPIDDMASSTVTGAFKRGANIQYDAISVSEGTGWLLELDASRSVRTAAETRGKNVALLPVMTVGRVNVIDPDGPSTPPPDTVPAPAPAPAPASPPVAQFTLSNVTPYTDETVYFYDTSTNTPTSWFWDFGNGFTGTAKNPSTSFAAQGTYTVSLTSTNANGSSTRSFNLPVSLFNPGGA